MSTVTVTETLVDPSTAAYAGWSATVRPVGSESDPAAPVYALGSDHTALGEVVCDVNSSGVWSTTLHPVSELTPSGSRYRISYTAPSGVQAPADVYIEPQTSPSTQRVEDILSTAPGALSAIAASSVTFSPTGTVSSTNVQAAIAEVASEGGASTVDVVSNVASSRILGRTTAGSGDSEELTAAQTKTLLAVTSTDISDFNSAAVSAGSATYVPLSLADAQGDIFYATADNTWARLAKGTALQGLRMNAGATAPEWADITAAAPLALSRTNSTDTIISGKRAADASERWIVTADGRITWLSGAGTTLGLLNVTSSTARFEHAQSGTSAFIFHKGDSGPSARTALFNSNVDLRGLLINTQNYNGQTMGPDQLSTILTIQGSNGGSVRYAGNLVHATATNASTQAFVARAAASQTANLQEWQDSSNAVLLAVDPNGFIKWVAGKEQTTVGAAGGASALPATPTKYLQVKDSAGTTLVVPAYAAA